MRDVAYGQIPRAQRVDKHARAAAWIESLAPDRTEDRAEMLAHHYREALGLAEAAGLETDSLRGPARDALTTASERAEALNAWAAAREHAEAALGLTAEDDPARPRLLLRLGRSSWFTGDLDTKHVVAARDGFLAHDEIAAAAEAEAVHSVLLWYRGEGKASTAAAERAEELVSDQPLSPAKAWVYSQRARRASLAGNLKTALRVGAEALEMAEELQRDDYASHALNTLGMARAESGDRGGLADLERSIELARRANSPFDLAHGCNNLANELWTFGELDEASRYLAQAKETAERFGIGVAIVWAEGEESLDRYLRGDYPEAVELAERFMSAHAEELTYQLGTQLATLGFIVAATGRIAEALERSERGLAEAREAPDPQLLGAALLGRAHALIVAGRAGEAKPLLDEILDDPALMRWFHWVAPLPLVLVEQGRGADYVAACERVALVVPWREAGLAAARGDFGAAADVYGRIGSRFLEAWARLLGAEHGAPVTDGELARARAYFEQIGATAYLARCETFSQASA